MLLEDREWEAYWWLPGNEERKVPGRLTFSRSRIRLELLGAFEDRRPGPLGHTDDEPRIHGLTKDQKRITLERNLGLGTSIHAPGFPVTTYGQHVVLVGAWYEAGEKVEFDAFRIRLSELDTWAVSSGFGYQLMFDKEGKSTQQA